MLVAKYIGYSKRWDGGSSNPKIKLELEKNCTVREHLSPHRSLPVGWTCWLRQASRLSLKHRRRAVTVCLPSRFTGRPPPRARWKPASASSYFHQHTRTPRKVLVTRPRCWGESPPATVWGSRAKKAKLVSGDLHYDWTWAEISVRASTARSQKQLKGGTHGCICWLCSVVHKSPSVYARSCLLTIQGQGAGFLWRGHDDACAVPYGWNLSQAQHGSAADPSHRPCSRGLQAAAGVCRQQQGWVVCSRGRKALTPSQPAAIGERFPAAFPGLSAPPFFLINILCSYLQLALPVPLTSVPVFQVSSPNKVQGRQSSVSDEELWTGDGELLFTSPDLFVTNHTHLQKQAGVMEWHTSEPTLSSTNNPVSKPC